MAKSLLKVEARKLRKEGRSIRDIAKTLNISKGTVSMWCVDIILTEEQIKNLLQLKNNAIKAYQLSGASSNRKKKLDKIEYYKKDGLNRFKNLSDREFFVSGLALYLAEGRKTQRTVFTNSDPRIVEFVHFWFKKFFEISPERFSYYVYINESHRNREEIVKNFWATHLQAPLSQFRKVVFIKSKLKKIYENHDTYYGTMHLEILKSKDLLYRINGLTEALLKSPALA
ncbi:MAG: hypothetical protein Q8R55_03470 [Candidatus Taylorbacteria bacterium]|nr:hypothetical protein [Candidatus Taylorbacteria bacterium]